MGCIDWTQKERYTEYHVLKWPTSHLHPRERTAANAGLEWKEKAAGMAPSSVRPAQPDGLGLGIADSSGKARWRSGGLGTDGAAQEGARETAQGREGTAYAARRADRSSPVLEAVSSAVQAVMTSGTHGAVYGAAYRAGHAVQKIGGHVREAAGRLRDGYLRRQKQADVPLRRNHTPTQRDKRRGTRQASREEALAMRSENHYLLDSYDKNGQYSMLGK